MKGLICVLENEVHIFLQVIVPMVTDPTISLWKLYIDSIKSISERKFVSVKAIEFLPLGSLSAYIGLGS